MTAIPNIWYSNFNTVKDEIFKINQIGEKVLEGKDISRDDALFILSLGREYLFPLFTWTDRIRQSFYGNRIDLCSVINARSGGCTEDCSFCSQSVHFSTGIAVYPLLPVETMIEGAKRAKSWGAKRFCLATSGRGIRSHKDLEKLCMAVKRITEEVGINVCATLGDLTKEEILALMEAGLSRFHHNLETAESYFPEICTTHTFKDRFSCVERARDLGISTCSGGLFGIGESPEQIYELARAIKDLDVDSVPINFLMPVKGTPLSSFEPVGPAEGLKIIALFRFMLPDKEIRVCGGRETALRELHPLIFASGANGMMVGNYLTKGGRDPVKDLQMLKDLGLEATF